MIKHLVKSLILLASVVLASCQEDMIVSVDPAVTIAPIKPMNAANNGPVKANMDSYTALQIPYARTHDAALNESYVAKHCVDISAVFPDWDAKVDDPASYDFVNTDVLIANMLKSGAKPFYRLGQSIEHGTKKYGIYPPKDYKKWARICEHIIRHYNEGWADGFHYDIEYWEIWNEPDLDVKEGRQFTNPRTWAGTLEQFNLLYVTAACHLRSCFPDIKIGGPAYASPLKPMGDFLDCVKKHGAPLDFFSWHRYDSIPEHFADRAAKVREQLDVKGFTETESILNEWNYVKDWGNMIESYDTIGSLKGASFVTGAMCVSQQMGLDNLMYYDARPTPFNGMFHWYTQKPLKGYYPFLMFDKLYQLGSEAECITDSDKMFACAALNGSESAIMLTYFDDDNSAKEKEIKLDITGLEKGGNIKKDVIFKTIYIN